MAIPPFKAAGTFTAGTGAITPPYPAAPNDPVAGDIALLVCESENEAISLSSAQGFVELGAQANKAAGTAATDPASRLAVFWKRCVGGDTAPTVADSGNHTTGRIYLYSGCIATGNPWDVYAEGNDGGANDLTGVVPGATTTVADCLIVLICSSSYNGTSTTEFSDWTNADLGNILERGDNTNTAGLGGGHGLATGEKATAGSYGDTTVTLAHTSYKGAMSIALKPAPPVVSGAAALSGAGTLAAIGAMIWEGVSALLGSGVLAAVGSHILAGAMALSASGAVAAAGACDRGGAAALNGEGIVAAVGTVTSGGEVFGAAGLSGQGTLAAVASYVHAGATSLTGNGTLAALGSYLHQGAAALNGEGTVAAAGARLYSAESTLTGEGTLVAVGTYLHPGAAALTGEGTITATGTIIEAPGSAGVLIGGATLWQKPQVSRKLHVVTGLITGSGGDGIVWPSWGTTGGGEVSGAAALGGQGTLAAVGSYIHAGASALSGNGTLAAVGAYIHQGAAALSGEGTVAAAGARVYAGQSALSGEGTVIAAPRVDWAGKAAFTGEGVLAATGSVGPEVFGAAALGGQGTLAAVGSYLHTGASALSGNGTFAGVGTYLHNGAAALSGEGTVVAAARLDWAGKIALGGEGLLTATGALEGAPPSFHVLPEHAFIIPGHARDVSAGHHNRDFTKPRAPRDFEVN